MWWIPTEGNGERGSMNKIMESMVEALWELQVSAKLINTIKSTWYSNKEVIGFDRMFETGQCIITTVFYFEHDQVSCRDERMFWRQNCMSCICRLSCTGCRYKRRTTTDCATLGQAFEKEWYEIELFRNQIYVSEEWAGMGTSLSITIRC